MMTKHGSRWKGGRVTTNGYFRVLKRDHPFGDRDGYVYEHRVVWEECHKAMLLPWANVHHINGNKKDNRIENLEGMMGARHMQLHSKKDLTDRFCFICNGRPYAYDYEHWRKHPIMKEEWLCDKCYQRLLYQYGKGSKSQQYRTDSHYRDTHYY